MRLWLKLYVGEICCALPASDVVSILPRVELSPVVGLPEYVPGLILYQGRNVPAIDLCQLMLERPSKRAYSTRMVMVDYPYQSNRKTPVVLIAENVTSAVRVEDVDFQESVLAEGEFVDSVSNGETGFIRALNVENLLTPELRDRIFSEDISLAR